VAYPEISASTIDSYIKSACDAIVAGSYVSARKYITLAQVAKKALPQEQNTDGVQHKWDAEIRDVLNAITELEAAENRASDQRRGIRVQVRRG